MKDKIKDLLAVLDMPEKEQKSWLIEKGYLRHTKGSGNLEGVIVCSESLADLAFRLRDEVKEDTAIHKETFLHQALLTISEHLRCQEEGRKFDYEVKFREADWVWWAICAKPIHWIIAALIAKELAKVKDGERNVKMV